MKRIFDSLLLVCFGVAIGVLICEAGLRVFGYPGSDERTGFHLSSAYGDVAADSWIFEAQPRNDELVVNKERVAITKRAGTMRVLVMGDSGTFGVGVGLENSFPSQLRTLASEKHLDVEVVNAGVVGMSTANEYMLYRDRLRQLKPDWIVIGFFMANDINFNLQHFPDLQGHLTVGDQIWRFTRANSSVAHFVDLSKRRFDERLGQALAGQNLALNEGSLVDEDGFSFLNYTLGEIALYRERPSRLAMNAFSATNEILSSFKALADSDGARFAIVLIPTSSRIVNRLLIPDSPRASESLTWANLTEDDLDFSIPTERILETCRKMGTTCIDPTDSFRKAGYEETMLPGDDHPSTRGHEILARSLSTALKF